MVRTQIQIPDELYRRAKKVAKYREVSLAELLRRGLEYMIAASPAHGEGESAWRLPNPVSLDGIRHPKPQGLPGFWILQRLVAVLI